MAFALRSMSWGSGGGAPSLQRLNQLVLALFRFAEPGLLWWSGLGTPRKHSLFENSSALFMREPESGCYHACANVNVNQET